MNNMFNEIIHSQASGQVHQILKPMTREEIISNPDECFSRIQKLQEAIQQYNDNYFKDKNSSSVREQVICEKLGYQHSKKKLGDDGFIEKKNNDGYYLNYIRGKSDIMDFKEVYDNRKWGLSDKFRLHCCYEDIKDKKTLQYWLIFYDI